MRSSQQQHPGSGRSDGWRALLVAALIPLAVSCEDVVVTPASVATIRIVPEEAQLGTGGTVQLSAVLEDENGRTVTGHPVVWTSNDEAIATVDPAGLVAAVGSGSTTIRGQAGGAQGSAVVRVLTAPAIVLSASSVAFAIPRNNPPPPSASADIAITNGGQMELTGLSAATSYSSGASGWLSTTLSRTTAPAVLTVSVTGSAGLAPGSYQATVSVSASSAPGSAVPVTVHLEVVEIEEEDEDPPPEKPRAPSNLSAQIVELVRIALSWTAQDGAATEFRIQRRLGDSGFQSLATVGGGTTTFVDASVAPGALYTYRVRACNDAGCSDHSNEASALTPPAPPSNLIAESVQKNRVRVAWTDNNPIEPMFRVERAEGSGSFSLLATTEAGATRHDDRTVDAGRTYRYRVAACNAGWCSAPSNAITVTTPD